MEKSKSYERNIKTIQALEDADADFKKLHSIEHHLYCYTESDLKLVIALAREKGYTVANEGRHEDSDDVHWSLDLVKETTPDIAAIEKQTLEIELIAEKAQADYDGWGTEVEE